MKRPQQEPLFNSIAEPVRFSCGHCEATDLVHALRYYIETHWKCRECRRKANPVLTALEAHRMAAPKESAA